MKSTFAILLVFISLFCHAQNTKDKLQQSFQFEIGRGKHGSGDLRGGSITSEYKKYFRKKMSYAIAFSGTIHDGRAGLHFNDEDGNLVDGSYRITTGGLQVATKLGLSFVRKEGHDVGIQVGPLLRYQASSYPDELRWYFPAMTGFPVPVTVIINKTPARTFAFGGTGQLYYNYTFPSHIFIGLNGAFQIDTNGDTISQLSIGCGMKF